MDSDSYKIILSISHRRIAFEYWQRDGEDKLIPFPSGKWPAPLALYCSATGVVIGEEALRATQVGTDNAFTDYFRHLSDGETCSVGGATRPVRNLLLEGAESIFNDFYRNVLIRLGSLSDNRASMPLVIVCESDVRSHERVFLKGLFRDSGYNHVSVENYDDYIQLFAKEELMPKYQCGKMLAVWTEGPDLTFTLFDMSGGGSRKTATFEGLGIDPRKEYVKKIIWERIQGQNPWLQFSDEEEAIDKVATDFLASDQPLVEDTVVLSDGQRYHYSLNRNSVNFYKGKGGTDIQERLEGFLRDCDVIDRGDVLLLLRGNISGNSYFEDNLRQGFRAIVKSDKRLRERAMRQIIDGKRPISAKVEDRSAPKTSVNPNPHASHPSDSGAAFGEFSKPSHDLGNTFESTNDNFGGFDSGFGGGNSGFGGFGSGAGKGFGGSPFGSSATPPPIPEGEKKERVVVTPPPPPPAEDSKRNVINDVAAKAISVFEAKKKQLKREWRSVKGQMNGKISLGKYDEALQFIRSFVSDCENAGAEDLMEEAKIEQMKVMGQRDMAALRQPKPAPKPKPEKPKPSPRQSEPASKPADEGAKLASLGKLKEARDWYRANGNSGKAKVMTDIIRQQKSVNQRKSDLADCQKTRDGVRVRRIIKELDDYLDLCEKGGVPAAEFRKLLSDYKKIKI